MASLSKSTGSGASQAAIAGHLFMTKTRVRQLIGEGVIPAGATLDEAREAFIAHLRMASSRRSDQSAEAKRWAEARARRAEIAAAREEGELIPAEEARAINALVVSMIVSGLDGLPARISHDLTIRRRAEAEIDALRGRIAEQLAKLKAEYGEVA